MREAKTLGEAGASFSLPFFRTLLILRLHSYQASLSHDNSLRCPPRCRAKSRNAARAVQEGPSTSPHSSPPPLTAILAQLEETLLIFGSLINADDEEGTKKVEAELEKVRKDGGIEEESEE